jgi:hypothetical protein
MNIEVRDNLNKDLHTFEEQLNNDTIPKNSVDTLEIKGFLPGSKILIEDPGKNGQKIVDAVRRFNNNPSVYISRFVKFISWSLFLLMPLYAMLFWLFFHKKRKYYYSHLITSINQHAFSFLVLIVWAFFQLVFPSRSVHPENLLILIIPVYMFIDTRKVYRQSLLKTLYKLFLILFIYALIIVLSVAGLSILWILRGLL